MRTTHVSAHTREQELQVDASLKMEEAKAKAEAEQDKKDEEYNQNYTVKRFHENNDNLTPLPTQPTEENPVIVDDYPYGFRLRTQIRYWIETTKNGQRFVSQTKNPKNGEWNKPKYSTYSQIKIVVKDEKGYVTNTGYDMSYSSGKEAELFLEKYGSVMSEYQKKEMQNAIVMFKNVYDKIKYTVKSREFRNKKTGEIVTQVPMMQMNDYEEVEDHEAHEKEQKEINRRINKLAVMHAVKEGATLPEAMGTFNRATR
jgi:hypothetical protein